MSNILKLLLVEDSAEDAALLDRELRRGGYIPQIERVKTGPAMTAALARQEWDLVITDYSLPQFSGLAAVALLQEQGADLPIILISGTVGEDAAVAAMRAGAHDFITKGNLVRLLPAVAREVREAEGRRARRSAEQALLASERRFRSLIENMSGIIAILDPTGSISYQSPSIQHTLGYRPEDLLGRSLEQYIHPDDVGDFQEFMAGVLRQSGVLVPAEFRVQHQDGSWRMLGAMGRNLMDDPGVQGIVLNGRDITQRKLLEEQLRQSQKLEAVGSLAGGVAHDFNNMLGAISGYSDLLMHRLDPDHPGRDCLEQIIHAADRAAALTRQLLAFSRKQVVTLQVLDLSELLDEIQAMLARLIGEDIELITRCDPALGRVKADPGQMEQVVLNLAINARDAMPQGGKLTIEARNMDVCRVDPQHAGVPPGDYVQLEVRDNGCGMDPETRARIFEPFFTTKEPGKGTGLGLATVYGIVQQCHGQIAVDSRLGQGSAFRIYLPRADEGRRPDLRPEAASPSSSGSETILLVEDESIVRGLIVEVLRTYGYQVIEADRGETALRICAEHDQRIDLLLTDVVMPGMSGRTLAERAAAVRPGMEVLFMSGYTDDAVVRHGVKVADLAFIQKPFTPAALAQKVREVLGRQALSSLSPTAGAG